MAKSKPAPAAEGGGAAAKGGKKKFMMIIAASLVACAGGGGGAWFYLHGKNAEAKPAHVEKKAPTFVPLDPFTINLTRENGDHYVQISFVYQVSDDKVADSIKTYLPIIRSRILLLLSSKKPSDLAEVTGKEKLVNEMLDIARQAIPEDSPGHGIEGALISSFVVQ